MNVFFSSLTAKSPATLHQQLNCISSYTTSAAALHQQLQTATSTDK